MNVKKLFDVIRAIKGSPLTQADVDAVNRALMSDVAAAARAMRMSERGRELVRRFEGCRLVAYPDPGSLTGDPWTIGYGATGAGIQRGTVWTQSQCETRLDADLAKFEIGVNLLLEGVPTNQNQFDALVSFAFNVGLDIDDDKIAEGLGDSTLLKMHKSGNYAGAKAQFAAWKYNDGKVMNGLIRRRAAEADLYGSAET